MIYCVPSQFANAIPINMLLPKIIHHQNLSQHCYPRKNSQLVPLPSQYSSKISKSHHSLLEKGLASNPRLEVIKNPPKMNTETV